jgi:hypothetical protein
MEAICSSEASADFHRTTRHYIPEYRTWQFPNSLPKNGAWSEYDLRKRRFVIINSVIAGSIVRPWILQFPFLFCVAVSIYAVAPNYTG